jgi:hypothetical protein
VLTHDPPAAKHAKRSGSDAELVTRSCSGLAVALAKELGRLEDDSDRVEDLLVGEDALGASLGM